MHAHMRASFGPLQAGMVVRRDASNNEGMQTMIGCSGKEVGNESGEEIGNQSG